MSNTNKELLEQYNYNEFVPAKFEPWMQFDQSPALGHLIPDFPLWDLDEKETSLKEILSNHLYTVVEFGSFT
jgi:hypothetical protein